MLLVTNENMGLCLYMHAKGPAQPNFPLHLFRNYHLRGILIATFSFENSPLREIRVNRAW